MPATDWFVAYSVDNKERYNPLAGWALCRVKLRNETECQIMIGFDTVNEPDAAGLDLCERASNAVRYVHRSQLDKIRTVVAN